MISHQNRLQRLSGSENIYDFRFMIYELLRCVIEQHRSLISHKSEIINILINLKSFPPPIPQFPPGVTQSNLFLAFHSGLLIHLREFH